MLTNACATIPTRWRSVTPSASTPLIIAQLCTPYPPTRTQHPAASSRAVAWAALCRIAAGPSSRMTLAPRLHAEIFQVAEAEHLPARTQCGKGGPVVSPLLCSHQNVLLVDSGAMAERRRIATDRIGG